MLRSRPKTTLKRGASESRIGELKHTHTANRCQLDGPPQLTKNKRFRQKRRAEQSPDIPPPPRGGRKHETDHPRILSRFRDSPRTSNLRYWSRGGYHLGRHPVLDLQSLLFRQFHVLLTLFSEFFSSFPCGTCALSVYHRVFSFRWGIPPTLGCTRKQP